MALNARPAVLVGLRVEAKERPQKGVVMSRSRSKHKKERKRRHNRQIAEGTRLPKQKIVKQQPMERRMVLLSSLDRECVNQVLDMVRDLDIGFDKRLLD